MFLYIRMALYFIGGALAGQGFGVWDGEAGTLLIHVDSVVPIITGLLINIGTFIVSRFAVKR